MSDVKQRNRGGVMGGYVVSYVYPGQVAHGDEPMHDVGRVYVRKGLTKSVWTYTYDPALATGFRSVDQATAHLREHDRPNGEIVRREDAKPLKPPKACHRKEHAEEGS